MATKHTLSNNLLIILGVVFLTLLSITSLPFLFNYYLLHLNPSFIAIFLLVPGFNLIFCVPFRKATLNDLTLIKYWRLFPLIFYYDPGPTYYRFKKIKELMAILKPGDILLQRMDNYIDGIVLRQTTYFTHMGIFYGDNEDKSRSDLVIHEISATGVDFISIKEFAKCDDILVLRLKEPFKEIEPSEGTEEAFKQDLFQEGKGVFSNKCHKTGQVSKYIKKELTAGNPLQIELQGEELSIYTKLLNKHYVSPDDYNPVVLNEAKTMLKESYDFNFDFQSFQRVSCVSFVWYAYKCLFPVHEVKIRPFYYFIFVKACVIVPDSFLESKGFDVVFSSIKNGIVDRKSILSYIQNKKLNFFLFIGQIIIGQLLILSIVKLITNLLASIFQGVFTFNIIYY